MPDSPGFRLSSNVLQWARNSMGLSIEEAAKKAQVTEERFLSWETGDKRPTYKQLENLAERVYKRPLAVLLMSEPPEEGTINKDFRTLSNVEANNLSPELRLAVRKAKRYQLILSEVEPNNSTNVTFKVNHGELPNQAASRFRNFLEFSISTQKSWNRDNAFNNFKSLLESIGVYVFHMKMPLQEARAFSLTGNHPIIVLNSNDAVNARIFSLIHEYCHILFNQNGIFRDSATNELKEDYHAVERFCNEFAAAFLVPDEYFFQGFTREEWSERDIKASAEEFSVSNEVIARKLLGRGIIKPDFFWALKRKWDAFAKSAKDREREILKEKDSKGIAQDIKLVFEKGRPYLERVINAYQSGNLSSADLSNYLETKFDHLPKLLNRLNL